MRRGAARRLAAVAAAATACLAAGAAGPAMRLGAAPAHAVTPGVNVELQDFAGSHGHDLVKRTGTRWARVFAWWGSLQPAPGAWDHRLLEAYRHGAAQAARNHVKVVLVVTGTPAWASATGAENGPPADPALYAQFIGALARELRPHVAAYEVWNEEDLELFWGGPPDPAAYARLLQAAHPAVKAAAPKAKVVFGGLTGNDYTFLDAAYRAGAGGHFDAVGVHTDIPCHVEAPEHYVRDPNGWISRWSFLGYRSIRRTMRAHGDRRPIWMTELGWAASHVKCPTGVWAGRKAAGVTERRQAGFLRRAYACLRRDRYVKLALWFTMRDRDPHDANAARYGLVRLDGTHRPAFAALRRVVARPPRARTCRPHYTGPHVRARADRHAGGDVTVRARVRAELGVARIVFRVDGRTYRRLLGPRTVASVRIPAGRLGRGRHTITVVASDTAHNGGRATVVVRRA